MRVDFFEKNQSFDINASQGGVYKIDLLCEGKQQPLCLYIGESIWIASRCGKHLYSFMKNPNYLGLKEEDRDNDEFTLRFSVVEAINSNKTIFQAIYKNKEREAIKKYKPLTQLQTSDRQISNKVEVVQTTIASWK